MHGVLARRGGLLGCLAWPMPRVVRASIGRWACRPPKVDAVLLGADQQRGAATGPTGARGLPVRARSARIGRYPRVIIEFAAPAALRAWMLRAQDHPAKS